MGTHALDWRSLSTREQAVLLWRHRRELACEIAPAAIEQKLADRTGVMLAKRDALAFVNQEGERGVCIAYVLVRPGMRGKGIGAQMLAAVRARFPNAPLSLQCYGAERAAFFERHGFIRPPIMTGGGYFLMHSDPAAAQAYVDTLPASLRRASGSQNR
ncbi:GNAT family N-acetyltransferase [Variovorax rhizosphaerae]|uniref:GNAT family N-acetyltransferase n=1 Tax=Variovorax rhizosphaerae TaxID=1836200 RepID=A0ABU8WYE3_9BURK